MFFFFHLVTGIIIGLLIGELLRDRRWIVPCVIGAVLPDLVDKPLNFLLLPSIDGNGRFLFHNLLVFLFLLVVGILVWKYYAFPIILALDIGILSHQILDSMWATPKYWLYPLLGPYPAHAAYASDYIFDLLARDLFNPSEWVFIGICICALVLYWKRGSLAAAAARNEKPAKALLKCVEVALLALCVIVLACGLLKIPLNDVAIVNPDQYAFTIVIIALAAVLVARWGAAPGRTRPAAPEKSQTKPARPGPAMQEIERMECCVRLARKDPGRTSFSAAKEITAAYRFSGNCNDASISRLALALLGTIIAATIAGGLVLFASDKELPGGILVLGFLATGLFAGYLVVSQTITGTRPEHR